MSEGTADPRRLRVRSGLGFVQFLRPALYALLVLAALFTFWAGGDIAGRALPRWTHVAAPTVFAVFLVVFCVYRFALIRARKYPAAIGLFQIGLGALIWVLLLPSTRAKFGSTENADDVAALMSSADPRVRALAAETAGYRPAGARYASELIDRLQDADPRVRTHAHASLVRLSGTDVGLSAAAWKDVARKRGWLK